MTYQLPHSSPSPSSTHLLGLSSPCLCLRCQPITCSCNWDSFTKVVCPNFFVSFHFPGAMCLHQRTWCSFLCAQGIVRPLTLWGQGSLTEGWRPSLRFPMLTSSPLTVLVVKRVTGLICICPTGEVPQPANQVMSDP